MYLTCGIILLVVIAAAATALIFQKKLGRSTMVILCVCAVVTVAAIAVLAVSIIGAQKDQDDHTLSGSKSPVPTATTDTAQPNTEENRKMDMIMWYDIDTSPSTNDRPDRGWWYLNPQHPNTVQTDGNFRTTTPLLGLYDQKRSTTARQHLYWIAALGCNALTADWTNYTSYRFAAESGWRKYTSGVYNNTEVLLRTAAETTDFAAPATYITVRLQGTNYDGLKQVLDDVYTLYQAYPSAYYKFADGTAQADKPFVVIFADKSVLTELGKGVPFTDDRFNIRWSNGYLSDMTQQDQNGSKYLAEVLPVWLFVEAEENPEAGSGYYRSFYKKGQDGSVEQTIAWASLHRGGFSWDPMNRIIDGKTTFERTIWDAARLQPKSILINRFNYALAWRAEPQEGLSLYESTHIEPNEDFGFFIFDNVRENLYLLNHWERKAPGTPNTVLYEDGAIKFSLEGYPTEYRISASADMADAQWVYLNINDWAVVSNELEEDTLYLQLRSGFGESEPITVSR